MAPVVRFASGTAVGWLAGLLLRWLFPSWSPEPHTCAVAGGVGQACRVALAWVSRPSGETMDLQARLTTPAVLLVLALALGAALVLLQFPATVLVPAASYVYVRILMSWQNRASGTLSITSLTVAARGGEILTLLAAIIKD